MSRQTLANTIAVYERLGKNYLLQTSQVVPPGRVEFMDAVARQGRILDVGCAGGRDAKAFVQRGFEVVGIDLTCSFLRIARREVPSATFQQMDVRRMTFDHDSFDAIWAYAVLLHLERRELRSVLSAFWRILRPGGVMAISMKRGRGQGYVAESLFGGQQRYFTFVTKIELERLVRQVGFKLDGSRIIRDALGRSRVQWVVVQAKK